MHQDIELIQKRIQEQSRFVGQIRAELGKVIVGQRYMIDRLLIGLLARRTCHARGRARSRKDPDRRTLSSAIRAHFQRIQFTPDLLPADLIGTLIFDPKESSFKTKKGPIFANSLLADEINRSPAKVQSALLEAMQERTVTIGESTFELDDPFWFWPPRTRSSRKEPTHSPKPR